MNYTELLQHIREVAQSAPQVNTVTRGEVATLDLDMANIFPLVHIDVSNGTFNNAQTISFEVSIAALQKRDKSNEVVEDKFWRQDNEVDNHNETLLIVQYIWSDLFREWSDSLISATDAPSLNKIIHDRGNLLDGWELSFQVEIPFSVDLCPT